MQQRKPHSISICLAIGRLEVISGVDKPNESFAFKSLNKCFPKSLIQLIFAPGNAVKWIGQVQIFLLTPLISLKLDFGSDRIIM